MLSSLDIELQGARALVGFEEELTRVSARFLEVNKCLADQSISESERRSLCQERRTLKHRMLILQESQVNF